MFFLESAGFIGSTRLPCGFIPVSYRLHWFHTPAGAKGEAFGFCILTDDDQATEPANVIIDGQSGHHLSKRVLIPERLLHQAECRARNKPTFSRLASKGGFCTGRSLGPYTLFSKCCVPHILRFTCLHSYWHICVL